MGRITTRGKNKKSKAFSFDILTFQTLAAGAGEQMKARYSQDKMTKLLEDSGFLIYEHLDHEEMTNQYFAQYNTANPNHPMQALKGVSYVLGVRKN